MKIRKKILKSFLKCIKETGARWIGASKKERKNEIVRISKSRKDKWKGIKGEVINTNKKMNKKANDE